MARKLFFIGFIILLITISVSFVTMNRTLVASHSPKIVSPQALTPHPTITQPFRSYTAPHLSQKKEYTIVMVGDSMTHALGPHGGTFNEFINEKYKPHGKGIVIDNYAVGSTNILSIHKAMTTKTTYWDSTFEPLLSRKFDLILVESFGYNPLSQFSLDIGLKWHNKTLDKMMKDIIATNPEARIVFVATIAPNKSKFALPVDTDTTLAERTAMVEEREAFIKNHITYAKEHTIPVINIYEKSLTQSGDGKLAYINPHDYIHPSAVGVDFIGQELAKYIYDNNIIPH